MYENIINKVEFKNTLVLYYYYLQGLFPVCVCVCVWGGGGGGGGGREIGITTRQCNP